ncbi:uncharacterized protein LOC111596809 [Drosophila hydei]|uniref:Uncharacterized protein LOC111596809 n=1 Tax=Drosophila hydei TaxID=7224 RepID=A0A6J1LPS4_DROHY|nr:uncharacterized protein LOC111596809 [Drosophila hydei]
MSSLHSELFASLLCLSLLLSATAASSEPLSEQQQQLELKLSELRGHKQLLQAEIKRLYMGTYTPEMSMLIEDLQQRQLDIQQQIDKLEGKAQQQDAQQLAFNLAADFELLQHKLNELKVQLDVMQTTNSNSSSNSSNSSSSSSSSNRQELPREAVYTSTPKSPVSVGSYFFTPLLAMPESLPSVGIAQSESNAAPSLIKRLLALLRPNAASTASLSSGTNWSKSTSKEQKQQQRLQLLNTEELLSQLQLQRQFLDDAINRMELLSGKHSNQF